MKIGVIDIGSNSVRLMLWADGKTLYKAMNTTRLGEGLSFSPMLKKEACERTAAAISAFIKRAEADGANSVYAFATAAVRSAQNPDLFLDMVRERCGIEVDVISGEREAEIGLCGALGNNDGGVIDVGGASTEVTVRRGGKLFYSKSVNVGTVRILDCAGRDINKIKNFIAGKITGYGEQNFSADKMYAVGGTATRLAAIKKGLKEYVPEELDGVTLTAEQIHGYANMLTTLTVEEIRAITICTRSADLIGGGAELMAMVMDKLHVSRITVSDGDNLEGYVRLKLSEGKIL